MRHFFRTHQAPATVVELGEEFFTRLGLKTLASDGRSRTMQGIVGTPEVTARMRLSAKSEGGHYTFVEVHTDQMGESRLDRNVKRFFVELHRRDDPGHALQAAY
jgi:hypothetical protein